MLGWTVIYGTLDQGIDSFTMFASHDGPQAWQEAKAKLNARYKISMQPTLYAVVRGKNTIYTEA